MLHRKRPKSQGTEGFTMIELLVAIVMVGTLAVIAAPSWQSFLDRQRMNTARNDLIGILRNAQDEAQARQQSRQVTFLPATASSPMSVMVSNASASTSGITTVLGSGNVGNKFTLVASTPIVFDNYGRVNVTTPYSIKFINSTLATPQYGSSQFQSCVIVTTLLGGLKAANNDLCN